VDISAKLKTLQAAHSLKSGQLVAHQTSTLAGIAASASSSTGLAKMLSFKQRNGPFLLLADSISTALQHATYLTPTLRKLAKQSWAGGVTLVFPARKTLAEACYKRGFVAVRVDADRETRRLAKLVGGNLLSSSLNRRGKAVQSPSKQLQYRWHRHISVVLEKKVPHSGQASRIIRIAGNSTRTLR